MSDKIEAGTTLEGFPLSIRTMSAREKDRITIE